MIPFFAAQGEPDIAANINGELTVITGVSYGKPVENYIEGDLGSFQNFSESSYNIPAYMNAEASGNFMGSSSDKLPATRGNMWTGHGIYGYDLPVLSGTSEMQGTISISGAISGDIAAVKDGIFCTGASISGNISAISGYFSGNISIISEISGRIPSVRGDLSALVDITAEISARNLPVITGTLNPVVGSVGIISGNLPVITGSMDSITAIDSSITGLCPYLPVITGKMDQEYKNDGYLSGNWAVIHRCSEIEILNDSDRILSNIRGEVR